MSVIDTTLLLVHLDEKGISVWRNRYGWWFAHQEALKLSLVTDEPKPVHGPYATAVEAGMAAMKLEAKAA